MNKEKKIDEIIEFVISYPESTASRAILRRHYFNRFQYESGRELGIKLKESLNSEKHSEIDFCYYLVK